MTPGTMTAPPPDETLAEAADRIADEAEAEIAAEDEETTVVDSQPGEQGIATQDEDEDEPQVFIREVSGPQRELSDELVTKLEGHAHDMGPEAVIDGLLQIVDVQTEYTVPQMWPGSRDEEYREAPTVQRIGSMLCRGCPNIEISSRVVVFLWKNKKTWTKRGVAVRALGKKFSGVERFLSSGASAAVIVNFQLFRVLNSRQKVAAVYSALRSLDKDGNLIPPQFEGYFDELQLLGTGTDEIDHRLARAVEIGSERQLPFQFFGEED